MNNYMKMFKYFICVLVCVTRNVSSQEQLGIEEVQAELYNTSSAAELFILLINNDPSSEFCDQELLDTLLDAEKTSSVAVTLQRLKHICVKTAVFSPFFKTAVHRVADAPFGLDFSSVSTYRISIAKRLQMVSHIDLFATEKSYQRNWAKSKEAMAKITALLKGAGRAGCRPRQVSVPLPSPESWQHQYPSHTVLKRCSGGCTVNHVRCESVKNTKIKRETLLFDMSNGKLNFVGIKHHMLTQHTKCNCSCTGNECNSSKFC